MTLKVFNNLTRSKEDFKTLTEKEVKFYSCGPTTYDFLHVGNARALVIGDLFHRTLKALGYKVTFVRNYTDVDDKIIDRAQQLGRNPLEHAEIFVQECKKDMDSLGMIPATFTPKVSETMPEIIKMIEDLIKNQAAYVVDGEVLFYVPGFKDYGKLSKKDLDSLQHGIRVDVDSKKKHPSDFVLWKPAKPGEPSWDSPWGKGRPGWHIECSAMAKKFLGDTIDLHHGGVDLMFPHHENEIAQSEAANQKTFCNCWAHNEFLNFGSEKMSKSLGNVVTIRKFIEMYGGQVLRQVLLSVHYRARLEWSDEVIERAISEVERIHEFALEVSKLKMNETNQGKWTMPNYIEQMKEELSSDFNSAGALGVFFGFIRDVRSHAHELNQVEIDQIQATLQFAKDSMGIINEKPAEVLAKIESYRKQKSGSTISEEEIKKLIEERKEAKKSKNFKRADEIRDLLKAQKITLKDNPDGTTNFVFDA
jgi:cysteinyl-tRNA synthetase